jgi:hypothetical protein
MSASPIARRGQTAVEMLFILAIVLTGVVVIMPTYTQQSSDATLVYAVKSAASEASNYISLGVTVSEWKYYPLNSIINNYTRHETLNFKLIGVGIESETDDEIILVIKFEHDLPLSNQDNKRIINKIVRFMKRSLAEERGFYLDESNKLHYAGKLVTFNVTVNSVTKVIS